jgi:hypothetical protein
LYCLHFNQSIQALLEKLKNAQQSADEDMAGLKPAGCYPELGGLRLLVIL